MGLKYLSYRRADKIRAQITSVPGNVKVSTSVGKFFTLKLSNQKQ